MLLIEERGTTGMYGPWRGAQSKLYQALGSLGITPKQEGEGGSFGFGKSGLIKGSEVRVVIGYTCFEEGEDDPGVTRRLLGVTYWGSHRLNDTDWTGMARLHQIGGNPDDHRPFENEDADRIAAALGLRERSADDPEDIGSAFCLVEPTVAADELEVAINRYWWPALEDPSLRFRADIRSDEQEIAPRPKQVAELQSFVKAYGDATTPKPRMVGRDPYRRRDEIWDGGTRLGVLTLLASPPHVTDQWSFPDPDDSEKKDASLVALMRNPRMVVEYLPLKQKAEQPPIVRGVFVASDAINDDLRKTEPFAHDSWKHDGDDAPEEARRYARRVEEKVREKVRLFQRDLKPPPAPRPTIRLPEWDRIMRAILRGDAPGPPPPGSPRLVSINPHLIREATDDGRLSARGRVTLGFTDSFPPDRNEANVRFSLRVVMIEDERSGQLKAIPFASVECPEGFTATAAGWTGLLTREGVSFSYRTEPYAADWTIKLIAEAAEVKD